jgi:hypothetical protein
MSEIGGANCLEAWREGVKLLRHHRGEIFNLLLTVDAPTNFDPQWTTEFNPCAVVDGADHIRDVINTIFPMKLASQFPSREQFYSEYMRRYDRGRRLPRNRSAWGTYFQRMIRFGESALPTNQLERAIDKLATWNHRSTTALVFHPTSPALDAPRTRGGPCWQFGELLWRSGDVIDFVVVYRNHDYFNKALGNLIALGQMLGFICMSAQKTPGRLICHSVHAYHQSSDAQIAQLARL